MRVAVDRTKCIGTGLCESVAPDVFQLLDDGELEVVASDVPADRVDDVRQAVDGCPTLALSLEP